MSEHDRGHGRMFDLSTEVAPSTIFGVDGDEYHILGFEHLSRTEEARITALFSRHSRLARLLEDEEKKERAERIALAMYDSRMELLTSLTDLPRDVAEKLPMSGQTKLMNAIAKETGQEPAEDEGGGGGAADDF